MLTCKFRCVAGNLAAVLPWVNVMEANAATFALTCRTLSGREYEIQVSAKSRLYDVKRQVVAALRLPEDVLINLYNNFAPLLGDTDSLRAHGVVEPGTLQVIEAGLEIFELTCRDFSGRECEIQVSAWSKLYEVKRQVVEALQLPEDVLITLYDHFGFPLHGETSLLRHHGVDEPCTLDVVELSQETFVVTCRMLSGRECQILVSECSRLHAVEDKVKTALELPRLCMIVLHDSRGPLRGRFKPLEELGIFEPCTLQVYVWEHPASREQLEGSPVSREERRARAAAAAENPEVPAFSPRRKFTEEQFQKWSQVFNQEGGNGKVKCTVERPSYLSADALAQMEGESVTSSTRVPTTLREDEKDLDNSD